MISFCHVNFSNETEGTALASAAHAGKVQIVAYLLNIGASANGSVEKYNLKVTCWIKLCNIVIDYHIIRM